MADLQHENAFRIVIKPTALTSVFKVSFTDRLTGDRSEQLLSAVQVIRRVADILEHLRLAGK